MSGNPYDGHTLAEQLEQTAILLQDIGVKPKTVIADLGYRGVDADIGEVELVHRGKSKSLTREQRCWLKGSQGDAIHALLCAVGFNIRWLLRAIVRKGLKGFFARLILLRLWLAQSALAAVAPTTAARAAVV